MISACLETLIIWENNYLLVALFVLPLIVCLTDIFLVHCNIDVNIRTALSELSFPNLELNFYIICGHIEFEQDKCPLLKIQVDSLIWFEHIWHVRVDQRKLLLLIFILTEAKHIIIAGNFLRICCLHHLSRTIFRTIYKTILFLF